MTDTDTLHAALADNARELQQAKADAELYARLTAAKGEVARLQKLGTELTAKFSAAQDREAKAERAARKAKFRNLRITTTYPPSGSTGLLHAIFNIRWEGPRWDYQTGATDWSTYEADGFAAFLSGHNEAFAWVMEFHSDQLPSLILDLAPGDNAAALEHYFLCKRRGALSGLTPQSCREPAPAHARIT